MINWPTAKQYLAAHYYLSEERPFCISEAQRAQLGALHLHVSFGPYIEGIQIPDLVNCTAAERKKRIYEWQKLGRMSRETAMRKFIDLISSLFPNWSKFPKLYYDFEQEWLNMPEISSQPIELKKASKGSPNKFENLKKRKNFEFRETTPTAFKKIQEMKKVRQRRAQSRIDNNEKSELYLYRRKKNKEVQKSMFPRVALCIKQYQEQNKEFLKDFVEDLQSYRGGNIRRTSATKMPEGFAFNDFDDIEYCKLNAKSFFK